MWGCALRRLRTPSAVDQLRRPRHDGFCRPRRHGREGRGARAHGLGDRRGRLLPDDRPGRPRDLQRRTASRSKVAVVDNSSLGMVRQWQTLFYEGRYSDADLHSVRIPDCVKLAGGPRLRRVVRCAGDAADVDSTMRQKAMEINDAPVVVERFVVERGRRGLAGRCRRAPASSAIPISPGPASPSLRRTTSRCRPCRPCRCWSRTSLGVLARVASLFSRRGFNIESLAVGPTEHDDVSRMTIVVNLEDQPLEQVTEQLNKLIEVLKVVELEDSSAVERELLLGQGARGLLHPKPGPRDRPAVPGQGRGRGRGRRQRIEVTGDRGKAGGDAARARAPRDRGKLVQSGMVAINRGSRSITDRSLKPAPPISTRNPA